MEIRGFLTTLLALLAIAADAQQNSATPKLVVGITVDQLRQDYMEFFSPLYGEKGFRRLWREGRYYVNADYNFYNPDRASSIASLFTGTVPMIHGIVSRTWLDPSTLLKKDCADDPDFMGNYTNQSTSAALLQATTLGDELKIFFGGKSLVYAVAPEREEAVMAAGHAADGAFWLNVENGMWCGTTYYGTFPYFVSAFNMQEGVDSRGDSLVWKPSRPVSDYKYVYSGSEPYAFEYGFAAGEGRYRRLKTSPLVNSEINRLLFRSFNLSELGRDDIPDLLSVTYYAGPYDSRPFVEIPMETQDAYVRLDRVLGELLDWIDQRVGLQNALVFLTSTGYSAPDRYLPANLNLPGGEFHLERCKALLNMYLMAIYGNGQWVDGYFNRHFFLNHELIKEKQLALSELRAKSSEFLRQMSGVTAAYTFEEILNNPASAEARALHKSTVPAYCGDVVIEVSPGWLIMDQGNDNFDEAKLIRTNAVNTPAFIMAPSVKPQKISTPVDAATLAPTISSILRIRSPNAAQAMPLSLGY